ncbi:MAG: hypothetical protein IPL61_24625 [Myxococcales bacterium]|nr:hypothetical protein [Myxococcales bacterium]
MTHSTSLALLLTTVVAGAACTELDPPVETSSASFMPPTVADLLVDAPAYPSGTILEVVPTSTTGVGRDHVLVAQLGHGHAAERQLGKARDHDGTVIWDIKEVGLTGRLELFDGAGALQCAFASDQLSTASGAALYKVAAGAVYPFRATTPRYRQVGDDLVDARGAVVAAGAPGQGAHAPAVLAEIAAVLDGACGATP